VLDERPDDLLLGAGQLVAAKAFWLLGLRVGFVRSGFPDQLPDPTR
jgi:hypothetical protein